MYIYTMCIYIIYILYIYTLYKYIVYLDLDLEQVDRQYKRYPARTSPPAEAWG